MCKIFDGDLVIAIGVGDNALVNFEKPDDKKQSLIPAMKNESCQLPNKLQLVIYFPTHFLLELLDCLTIKIAQEEIYVVLLQQVLMRL